jgi:preprotein translocase subunit YajC
MTASLALAILAAQAPAGGRSALIPFAFQVVAIFGIFYFVMIRPQQKQRRTHEDRLRNLRKGDEVVTAGGIVARVVHISETKGEGKTAGMEDRITIKSDESRLIVERGRIARVLTPAVETPAPPAAAAK